LRTEKNYLWLNQTIAITMFNGVKPCSVEHWACIEAVRKRYSDRTLPLQGMTLRVVVPWQAVLKRRSSWVKNFADLRLFWWLAGLIWVINMMFVVIRRNNQWNNVMQFWFSCGW
jgi:hypothetical protein